MIVSVETLKQRVPSLANIDNDVLQTQLDAVESLIRKYSNNNFQRRNFRTIGDIVGGELKINHPLIAEGDTVEISKSLYNDGLFVVGSGKELFDEDGVLVTKVVYPPDVVLGTINLIKWENENRGKVGIQSESLSRHSVTYFNMDGDNSSVGYPKALLGFLKPYMKARF